MRSDTTDALAAAEELAKPIVTAREINLNRKSGRCPIIASGRISCALVHTLQMIRNLFLKTKRRVLPVTVHRWPIGAWKPVCDGDDLEAQEGVPLQPEQNH